MRYALLLITPLFLTGCLAFAAGAAGGAMTSNNDDSIDQIDYYITTNSPPDSIAQAMRRERVTLGMSKEEVRLVVKAHDNYESPPHVDTLESGEEWRYPHISDSDPSKTVVLVFDSTDTVVKDNVE